jgi:hypothetical protein
MNRMRLMMITGVLAFGGWELGVSPAQAQAPGAAAAAPTPRSYYRWGYNGLGYYPNASTLRVPLYRGGYLSSSPHTSAFRHNPAPSAYREPGTGRNIYLAKPWLQPLQ